MTSQRQAFSTYNTMEEGKKIFMGDNGCIEAIGVGNVVVQSEVEDKLMKIIMKNVLHVSKLHSNLFPVSHMVKEGCKVEFFPSGGSIRAPNNALLAQAIREANLFYIKFKKVMTTEVASVAQIGRAHV